MIHLQNVTKTYKTNAGRKVILDDVTITLPRGLSVGLLGRNGAGKSTLLRMIGGSVMPDSGQINRECSVSWPLGFGGGLHGALTGAQNVRFIARTYGVDTDDLIAFVEEFAELGDCMHMPVSTYSSGMKARLAFGVSMGIDFDVYLVDEITAVGDAAFKRKARSAFMAKSSRSDVIMVSHATNQIREYCDVGIVLEGAQLMFFPDVQRAIKRHDANMRLANRAHI